MSVSLSWSSAARLVVITSFLAAAAGACDGCPLYQNLPCDDDVNCPHQQICCDFECISIEEVETEIEEQGFEGEEGEGAAGEGEGVAGEGEGGEGEDDVITRFCNR